MTPEAEALIRAVQAALQGERPELQRRVADAMRDALKPHTGGTGFHPTPEGDMTHG